MQYVALQHTDIHLHLEGTDGQTPAMSTQLTISSLCSALALVSLALFARVTEHTELEPTLAQSANSSVAAAKIAAIIAMGAITAM